jgi:4-hydroxy-tetrahydrodipicolinate synthase
MAQMIEAAERNDFTAARDLHHRLMPLMLANFVESNPGPVKAAMAAMGLIEEAYRLPIVGPKPESRDRILKALKDVGLDRGDAVGKVRRGAYA